MVISPKNQIFFVIYQENIYKCEAYDKSTYPLSLLSFCLCGKIMRKSKNEGMKAILIYKKLEIKYYPAALPKLKSRYFE